MSVTSYLRKDVSESECDNRVSEGIFLRQIRSMIMDFLPVYVYIYIFLQSYNQRKNIIGDSHSGYVFDM